MKTLPKKLKLAGTISDLTRRNRPISRRAILVASALLVFELPHASAIAPAAYEWTEIVVPGAMVDVSFGPNDKGQVAINPTGNAPARIYQNGQFTPLPDPPAGYQVATVTGINDTGVIVGVVITTSDTHAQGFILVNGSYTFFSRPGWQNTTPRAIGNSGLITGYSSQDTGPTTGFLYDPTAKTFTDVTPPGSTFTFAQGINKFGRITGHGQQPGIGRYGFVWQMGTVIDGERELVPFLDRFLVADGPQTNARGINDAGVITGFTVSGTHLVGFVGSATRGYQLLLPPGGDAADSTTSCEGINNLRQVFCIVVDAAGNSRGFIGTPED